MGGRTRRFSARLRLLVLAATLTTAVACSSGDTADPSSAATTTATPSGASATTAPTTASATSTPPGSRVGSGLGSDGTGATGLPLRRNHLARPDQHHRDHQGERGTGRREHRDDGRSDRDRHQRRRSHASVTRRQPGGRTHRTAGERQGPVRGVQRDGAISRVRLGLHRIPAGRRSDPGPRLRDDQRTLRRAVRQRHRGARPARRRHHDVPVVRRHPECQVDRADPLGALRHHARHRRGDHPARDHPGRAERAGGLSPRSCAAPSH